MYVKVSEQAKLVRAALKDAFPHTHFSVQSGTDTAGASVVVRWTAGPTEEEVRMITNRYQPALGESGDAPRPQVNQSGETILYAAQWISCHRS